jgi:hypothetical protein
VAIIGLWLAVIPSTAAAADPFVLFLLRMLRDQAISSAIESGVTSTPQPARPPAFVVPPPMADTEAERIRRMIDESFVHLRPEQRRELHASLTQILDDPKNAAQRREILAAFTAQADATRQSHAQPGGVRETAAGAAAADGAGARARSAGHAADAPRADPRGVSQRRRAVMPRGDRAISPSP